MLEPKKLQDENVITDEDLVPLELLDIVYNKRINKLESKRNLVSTLVIEAKKLAAEKIKELKVEN